MCARVCGEAWCLCAERKKEERGREEREGERERKRGRKKGRQRGIKEERCYLLDSSKLCGLASPLALEHEWGDQALDLRALRHFLAILLELPADDVSAHVILFAEGEELADFVGPLGTQPTGDLLICEAFDGSLALCVWCVCGGESEGGER